MRFSTRAIRVGQAPTGPHLPVIPPIYQTATYAWENLNEPPAFDYSRVNNPSRAALEEVLASLENGTHCVCTGSGMAAVSAALSLLKSGDHLLMASDIYGGTHRVVHTILPNQGITFSEFDASDPSAIAKEIRPNTKMLIFETPTNPTLRIMDVAAVAKACADHGILCVIDNTFASPYLQRPLDLGCDIVVHSTTKYLGGHSDIIGGALIVKSAELYEPIFNWAKSIGTAPGAFDCWLTLRGVKTLALRMEKHCSNAIAVASALEKNPAVARVNYPGLKSHPGHSLAAKQMSGFGGMMSFEVNGTVEDAKRVAESTKVFLLAESLGGVESLIGYPPMMSHAAMTEEQRESAGIPPTLIRLSVGIEDAEDLVEDLEQALHQVRVGVKA